MRVEKKIWPEFYGAMASGKKRFDLRLADFDCKEGDVLVLREWDPTTKEYTGRSVERTVTYAVRTKDVGFWPKEDVEKYGFMVIGWE